MQSYLVVAQQQGLVEELHRQAGGDLQVIPLRSVSQLDDTPNQRVAAVVIRVPSQLASPRPSSPRLSISATGAGRTLEDRVDELERHVIEDCLVRNGHRRKETAEELGISRVTLYNKMKKFGLL